MEKQNIRTENDKLLQSGIKVILGGKEYIIKPLSIKYSSEWRSKAVPLIMYFAGLVKANTGDIDVTQPDISVLFTKKMDEITDCFFGYARELDREAISEVATDGEIMNAFMEVFDAFVSPFSNVPTRMAKSVSQ